MNGPGPRPNLTTCLTALEEAIVCAQTAQVTGEANPVDTINLESRIQQWRADRAVLLDIIHRETP